MISDAVPHIEVINKTAIKEPGFIYKSKVNEIKEQLENIQTQVIDAEEGIILEAPLKGQSVDDFLGQLAADLDS